MMISVPVSFYHCNKCEHHSTTTSLIGLHYYLSLDQCYTVLMNTATGWCKQCQHIIPVEAFAGSIERLKLELVGTDTSNDRKHTLDAMLEVLEARHNPRCLECGSVDVEVLEANKHGNLKHVGCSGELIQRKTSMTVDFKQDSMSYIYDMQGDFIMREMDFCKIAKVNSSQVIKFCY